MLKLSRRRFYLNNTISIHLSRYYATQKLKLNDHWGHAISKIQDNETTDNLANFYDKYADDYGWIGPKMCTNLLLKYGGLSVGNILDCGCGTGMLGEELIQANFSRCNIYGIDISNKSLEIAENKNCYDILEYCDLERDKLPILTHNGSLYDAIICCGVLTHVNNKKRLINKLINICKPNGLIILSDRADMMANDTYIFDQMNQENNGKFYVLEFTDPIAHNPNSEIYGDNIESHFYCARICS
eukprot:417487_1